MAEGNIHYRGCNVYGIPQGRVEYLFITYDIIETKDTTVSVATYDMRMPSIRGGILEWNINLYFTPMDQSDCSISRTYVVN